MKSFNKKMLLPVAVLSMLVLAVSAYAETEKIGVAHDDIILFIFILTTCVGLCEKFRC